MPFQASTPEGNAVRTAAQQAGSTPLDSLTVTQAVAYVNANVVDLPSAKAALIILVKILGKMESQIVQLQAQIKTK